MPSRPIQAFGPGFLNLMYLKNMGRMPDTLLDDVQGVLAMEPWYLRGARRDIDGTIVRNVAAGTAPQRDDYGAADPDFVVPENTWRYIHEITLYAEQTVTTGNEFVSEVFFSFTAPPPATWWYRASDIVQFLPLPAAPAAAGDRVLAPCARDFWLPPGARLIVAVGFVAGANLRYAPRMAYSDVSA